MRDKKLEITHAASAVAPPERNYHFTDEQVMDALVGTEYLSRRVRNALMQLTSGEKFSLFRAVAKLASPVAGGSARIAEIASRLAAATPGPWASKGMTVEGPRYSHTSEGTGTTMHYRGNFTIGNHWASREQRCIDAAFIAAAWMLNLLKECRDGVRS